MASLLVITFQTNTPLASIKAVLAANNIRAHVVQSRMGHNRFQATMAHGADDAFLALFPTVSAVMCMPASMLVPELNAM